ncbi:MAG: MFS transporter, partial [Bacteroidetes bacterium]
MKEEIKPASVKEKTLFGHPVGLFYLFFAETWERFSYYGMRALLVLYIVDEFFLNLNEAAREEKAFGIYGAYGSLVYATPLIGGIIADRFIGYRKSILLGGILMALGHFAMAIEHPVFFYWALGLLVAGNGFFKPNISALVGTLYQENDPRRDGGFTIFYMGVNLGAFFSPLVCGYLGHTYGWHYGFGAAGVGMLIGLILFVIGSRSGHLGNRGYQPKTARDIRIGGLMPVDR